MSYLDALVLYYAPHLSRHRALYAEFDAQRTDFYAARCPACHHNMLHLGVGPCVGVCRDQYTGAATADELLMFQRVKQWHAAAEQ